MSPSIALITGANTGMGKETALALAKQGMHVVMLCRNQQRGEAALADVRKLSGNPKVDLMLCDLADMASIHAFCQAFRGKYPSLQILVNNAGMMCLHRQETKDGLEMTFGVSHIGHFLLTMGLLPLMRAGSRIVVIGSSAHRIGSFRRDDLPLVKGYHMFGAYGRAKLCNMLFTKELARRLAGTAITVNCVHPGAVATSIATSRQTGFGKTVTRLLGWVVQSPAQGAETAIYVAISADCADVTGAYFQRKRVAKPSRKSQDEHLAQELWAVSERITGTTFPCPPQLATPTRPQEGIPKGLVP